MTRLIKFKNISEQDLDKIINKHYTHWKQFSDQMNLEDTVYKFKNLYVDDKELPIGYAFYDDDKLIGFCTLKKEELAKYNQYYPWICSVMIFDEYRYQGYGSKMIELISNEAKTLGYNTVYLWTDQAPEFYEKIGFSFLQPVEKDDGSYGRMYYKKLVK